MGATKYQKVILIGGLLAIHLAITLPLAYWVNIWADEASSLYTTGSGLAAAVHGAVVNERQAPLYFALLAIWRLLSQSIFFARLLSILFSSAAIILFGRLAFRSFSRGTATVATCFFALHPFLIWTSTEIRVYSLVILISIILIIAFQNAFPDGASSEKSLMRARGCFAIFATIGVYTNYYLGFGLVGFLFVLIVRREWVNFRNYVLMMVGVGILCLPLIYIVALQVAANTAGFQQDRPIFDGIRFLWHHLLTFGLPAEIFPDEISSTAADVRLMLARLAILGIAVLAIVRWRRISLRTSSYGVLTAIIGALFLTSYLIVGENYVAIRHAAVLFVPFILFAASGLSDILETDHRRPIIRYALAVPALLILSFFAYSIFTLYPDMKKRGDWDEVAGYVRSQEQKGDSILIFTTYDALAFQTYYNGQNPVLPDKNYFDFELEDKFGSSTSMTKRIDFAISAVPRSTQRLWLVESEKCMITDACAPLENYVQANYTVIENKDFYRERVRLLIRKTQ